MTHRGSWSSRIGFILAAAGSAVGLGNIWGFPTRVGQGGGAAFVLIYLMCIVLICFPILVSEIAIGRRTQMSPVRSFSTLKPSTYWWLVGGIGVLAGVGILSFYSVIAGWTVAYAWFSLTGQLTDPQHDVSLLFENFTARGWVNVSLTLLVLTSTAAVLIGGIRTGIERVTKALMPVLIGLLVILAFRALTLPGAAEGLRYYLTPDPARLLDISVFNSALGQAFFSLSLGMGAILTYGSYLDKRTGIASAAIWVALLDTLIALLAGFIIFPAGFSITGFDPSTSGPGLIFAVLPRLFSELPGGDIFGATFFVLLSVAALTSTISLLEVPVSHCVDARGWTRRRSVATVTGIVFVIAVPSALGNGSVELFTTLPILGIDFLTLMSTVWNDFALPIGGLFTALFVGLAWGTKKALVELTLHNAWFPAKTFWEFLIRWVCPMAIALIIGATFLSLY
tara:strand:+ start:900 stop:2258 length:1359 start_codon:yes stop_codon:yes gene_type:complete